MFMFILSETKDMYHVHQIKRFMNRSNGVG